MHDEVLLAQWFLVGSHKGKKQQLEIACNVNKPVGAPRKHERISIQLMTLCESMCTPSPIPGITAQEQQYKLRYTNASISAIALIRYPRPCAIHPASNVSQVLHEYSDNPAATYQTREMLKLKIPSRARICRMLMDPRTDCRAWPSLFGIIFLSVLTGWLGPVLCVDGAGGP